MLTLFIVLAEMEYGWCVGRIEALEFWLKELDFPGFCSLKINGLWL